MSLTGVAETNDISVSPKGISPQAKSTVSPVTTDISEEAVLQNAESSAPESVKDVPPQRATLLRAIADFLSDLYLSFVYWSILTSLTPTLFYFSVWELGLTGSELTLLFTVSPFLLGITPFAEWCRSRWGRTTLHLLSLTGLAAYALDNPTHRLFAVSNAAAIVNIGAAVDWTSDTSYQGVLVGLGLLLSSIAKHANHSNVPTWPIVNGESGGYNKTGLVLAVLAILNYATRQHSIGESVASKLASRSSPLKKEDTKKTQASRTPTQQALSSWLKNAIALGSMMFTLHFMLADSSTLIAWSWTGYPIVGPVPHLHGSLTHIAQALGLGLPLFLDSFSAQGSNILLHPLWFVYGSAGAYVMYAYKDWSGYIGGLTFAIFLMSIIPAVLHRVASTGKVARTHLIAWLLVSAVYVVSVLTAAYAFVPGGQYFRERTDLVLVGLMIGLGLAFQWPGSRVQILSPRHTAQTRIAFGSTLAVFTVLSLLVTMYRWPTTIVKPHRPGARIARTGIWTVHFGIDNEGRDSQQRIRNLVKDMELDVVGLLETDLHRTVFGNRDLTRVMVEELGYHVDIGPGPNSHTWGAALLSKFPIINSTHHLLPSPDGELAPAIEAVLDMYGTEVTVVVAHNGQEETPLDRELQATEIARIMSKSYPRPVIFLGYVVTKPQALRPSPYEIMVSDGRVHDIDEQDSDRWCEYIFYRGLYRTAYARVSRSTITDTELQIGQFVVPRNGLGITDDSHDARYLRSWKEELPEDHWFPMEYYPETGGIRGHYYHVFNTPLYYQIPDGVVV
ncbi:uncharacterized protein FIBRA_08688 [Fibroporia radiculosa]|uniref:Uncharacterized protein n=1 Tax=Fibroporia radiculosa TaxID=599839 RepID=J4I365_9APHY|nr:uncharacterized protein FIBRA_08688 [Fibroporia radiculosa]CCM06427.1 predicted protein [Fibroporia radiculosa]